MKTLITLLFTLFTLTLNAAEPLDTLAFTSHNYKVIEDVTTNSKGNPTKKYYILCDGYLNPTNKTTYDKIKLCQKHNAKIKLYAVVTRKTKIIKRIIAL